MVVRVRCEGSLESQLESLPLEALSSVYNGLELDLKVLDSKLGEVRSHIDALNVEIAGLDGQRQSQEKLRETSMRPRK